MSTFAVLFFFLFPEPQFALIGALMVQTLAFITIAGKSLVDGVLLCGISIVLLGVLPTDHPLASNADYYEQIRWPLIWSGAVLIIITLITLLYKAKVRKNVRENKRVIKPHVL